MEVKRTFWGRRGHVLVFIEVTLYLFAFTLFPIKVTKSVLPSRIILHHTVTPPPPKATIFSMLSSRYCLFLSLHTNIWPSVPSPSWNTVNWQQKGFFSCVQSLSCSLLLRYILSERTLSWIIEVPNWFG